MEKEDNQSAPPEAKILSQAEGVPSIGGERSVLPYVIVALTAIFWILLISLWIFSTSSGSDGMEGLSLFVFMMGGLFFIGITLFVLLVAYIDSPFPNKTQKRLSVVMLFVLVGLAVFCVLKLLSNIYFSA